MTQKIDTTIIIVTFNSEKYISTCLRKILKYIPARWNITVVDNNSSDDTFHKIQLVSDKKDKIKTFPLHANKGFAWAVNYGITKSHRSDYYLLLNPDVVPNSDTFKGLVASRKSTKAGIYGGKTIDQDGEMSGCYFRQPNIMVGIFDFTNMRKLDLQDKWHKYFYYRDVGQETADKVINVDVVTGGFMMISRDTIDKIGLLDERFFMYLEDVDYCKRARDSNIRIVHCSSSSVIHFGGKSSRNKDGIRHSAWIMSRKKYFLKHFSLYDNIIVQTIFIIDDFYIFINMMLKS